jgi:hypothetical protein
VDRSGLLVASVGGDDERVVKQLAEVGVHVIAYGHGVAIGMGCVEQVGHLVGRAWHGEKVPEAAAAGIEDHGGLTHGVMENQPISNSGALNSLGSQVAIHPLKLMSAKWILSAFLQKESLELLLRTGLSAGVMDLAIEFVGGEHHLDGGWLVA